MSSNHFESTRHFGRAESAFRAAFDRLKTNTPELLPKNSPITQNNVAREAGLDPSALKKSRFPRLIAEIQVWVEENGKSTTTTANSKKIAQKRRTQDLKDRLNSVTAQRDNLLNMLVEADARILELTMENEHYKAQMPPENVTPFRPRKPK